MKMMIKSNIKRSNENIDIRRVPFSQILLNSMNFFRDYEENHYCLYSDKKEKKYLYNVNSIDFENLISRLYLNLYKDFIMNSEKAKVISGINALCANAEYREAGSRLLQISNTGDTDSKIIYNLNQKNKIVEVTAEKIYIGKNSDFRYLFADNHNMLPQVEPDLDVPPENLLGLLKELFIISENDYLLLAVYICTLFIKDIQHPILTAYGDFGSGKSTALKTIKRIIDPSSRDLLFLNQTNRRDFTIALTREYFTAFDNVTGKLDDSIMNILCQVVTGGTISVRKLYTNTEEVTIPLKRCLAMNGTDIIGKRNDLLERSLLIYFKRLSEAKALSDSEYNNKLNSLLPGILGSVFNILSRAIAIHDTGNYELPYKPRMLEWTNWAYCCAEGMTTGLGEEFCKAYGQNLNSSNTVAVIDNPYIACIIGYFKEYGNFIGTSTKYFQKIIDYAQTNGYDTRDKRFPSCITQVWQKMKNYSTNLRKMGIVIYEPVNKGSHRELKILGR